MRFLQETILEAARTHVGETKTRSTDQSWLNREVRAAIRERNALGRQVKERR